MEIRQLIDKCILKCWEFAFNITNVICDGAPTNRAFIKAYFRHEFVDDKGKITMYANHPVHRSMMFSIPDPSHVIKKVRKSLAGCFENRDVYTNVPNVGVDGSVTGPPTPRLLSLKKLLSLHRLMQSKFCCAIYLS